MTNRFFVLIQYFTLFILANGFFSIAWGQTKIEIGLDESKELARKNYPMIRQMDLLKDNERYALSNLNKSYLPQIQVIGQATYQSEVTALPIQIPFFSVPRLNQDQYRAYADLNQILYDGGLIKNQKKIQKSITEIDQQKLEVELYKIHERINQLFFGILLLEEQLKQIDLLKQDIQNGLNRLKAAVKYGVSLPSEVDVLQAEWLKVDQRAMEVRHSRDAMYEVLGVFINKSVANFTVKKPNFMVLTEDVKRPELNLFQAQRNLAKQQQNLLSSKLIPRLNLFAQGGYGRPGLNMLSNEFAWYSIGGLRLNWSVSSLYSYSNDKQQIGLNTQMLDVQQEAFLFNTRLAIKQQSAEIIKYQELLGSDHEIVKLRNKIKVAAAAKLEQGIIQSNDFLREVNAADLAEQTRIQHEIQLLSAQYNQQFTIGK